MNEKSKQQLADGNVDKTLTFYQSFEAIGQISTNGGPDSGGRPEER
jgi:hypothetical protein